MSLLNQIIAAVFAVLIGLVSGTIYIMSDSSKSMLTSQLQSHSKDTATNLGMHMAPFIAAQDSAAIETIVNAIFDSGYYEKIQVTNFDNEDLFTALRSPEISDEVPRWFIKLIAFDTPNFKRAVTHSWSKVGFVEVKTRAGYAYEELWKGTQTTLIWFISLSLISVLFISSLLRLILRPLKSIEAQAIALSNKEYIEETKLPKTKELRSVVITMNSMIARVRTMFNEQSNNIEELRRTAYLDDLTGLANSRSTLAQLSDKLDNRDDEGPCTLYYVHIANLNALNEKLGQENANNLIKQLAEKLNTLGDTHTGAIAGRLSGSDMLLLIPQPDSDTVAREVNSLLDAYTITFNFFNPDAATQIPVHIAAILAGDDISSAQILSTARIAIDEAIGAKQASIYKTLSDTDLQTSSSDWSAHVADAVNQKKVFFQYQTLVDSQNSKVVHKELLVRILNQTGEPCAAAKFIRIVQQLGLIEALDKAALEQAVSYLDSHNDSEPLAINVSLQSLEDGNFDQWLMHTIADKAIQGRLNIEINESSVLNNVSRIASFRQLLTKNGIGFGVDNFGVHPSGFSYLYQVHPDYIKIDGSLCQQITSNAEDRFFMGSLVTVAKSLSIPSYAQRVEQSEQIEQLRILGIVATQGFIHGIPENLNNQ
ncbi:MAG: hypothetical protein OFPI_44220 [Osedax symbiont Rs2]|nr:MAG: hypothetical protein OFPI_44220 [Osedax symbiont Rs2]